MHWPKALLISLFFVGVGCVMINAYMWAMVNLGPWGIALPIVIAVACLTKIIHDLSQ